MKILVGENNIVQRIITGSIEFDVDFNGFNFTKIDNLYCQPIDENTVKIYDFLESNLPKYYTNCCYTYDESKPNEMTFIDDEISNYTIVNEFKIILMTKNDKIFNKIKYIYYDQYDNMYDLSMVKNYIVNLDLTDNTIIEYEYNGKKYTINELLHIVDINKLFYQTCYNKKIELENTIEFDCTSISTFEMFGEIEDYWPKENEKLNLDGTISIVIPNKFKLGATINKNIIDADGIDNVEVSITLYYDDVIYSGADGISWFVPVLGIDGNQIDMVEITLINGQTTINWSIDKKGIYSFRMDLVRPNPKASIPDNIEIIAK